MQTNKITKHVMLALAALGISGAAVFAHADEAGQTPTHGPSAKGAERHAKMAEHIAKRQAKLHDQLKLTAAQEPAWATFIAAAAKPPGPRGEHQDTEKLAAPERLEKWIAMSKDRIAVQETQLASLKTFYAVLTPEQRKVFDDSVPGGKHGGWGGHHGPRGHGDKHAAE